MLNCNLEYYKAFYYTGIYQSMSKAADALYLTQPAISSSVRKLEGYLECKLFQRTSRGLVLTEEGRILHDHISRAFTIMKQGEQKVRAVSDYMRGSLVLGASETPLCSFLIPCIESFKKDYPDVHISVNGHTTPELIDALKNGLLDMAFILSSVKLPASFDAIPLMEFEDVFVAKTEYAKKLSQPCSLKSLSAEHLISLKKGTDFRDSLNDYFIKNGEIFTPDYSVENISMILPLVSSNLGIGILPRVYVKEELEKEILSEIKVEPPLPKRTLYLARNKAFPTTTLGQIFIKHYVVGNE